MISSLHGIIPYKDVALRVIMKMANVLMGFEAEDYCVYYDTNGAQAEDEEKSGSNSDEEDDEDDDEEDMDITDHIKDIQ